MRLARAPLIAQFSSKSLHTSGHISLCLSSATIHHAAAATANFSPKGPGSSSTSFRQPLASVSKGPPSTQGPTSPGYRELLATSNRCTNGLMPVGKLLALRGVCSRGEGDEFFSLGLVMLDGRRLERNEAYVHPDAPIRLAPRAERLMQQKVTVLLHKPMHFLACQTDKQVNKALWRLLSSVCMRIPRWPLLSRHAKREVPFQARGGGGKPLSISLLCPENHWASSARCGVLDPRRFKKLVAAGRLDADSSGLQVFTQVR